MSRKVRIKSFQCAPQGFGLKDMKIPKLELGIFALTERSKLYENRKQKKFQLCGSQQGLITLCALCIKMYKLNDSYKFPLCFCTCT